MAEHSCSAARPLTLSSDSPELSAPRRARTSLGAYLALAFCMLSVLLTLLAVSVIERSASRELATNIGSDVAEHAHQTVSRLDRGMYERYREIRRLADRLARLDDPARIRQELDSLVGSYRFYSWVGVAGPDGRVRQASGGLLQGQDVSQRPWFQAVRQEGRHLGDVHEAVLLSRLLAPGDAGPMRFYDVAFALDDQRGAVRGVLGAHISWAWAQDVRTAIFTPIGRQATPEPLIVSTTGRVLLGPPDLEGRQLDVPSLRKAGAGTPGYTTETWPDGREYLVGYSRSQGFQDSPGLGWTVLVREPVDSAFAPVRELKKNLLGWGLAIAVLFSALGLLLARLITRPLHQLARAARKLEVGEPGPVRAVGSYREVQTLAHALNSLVHKLRERAEELRDANAGLEHRVQARTAELAEAFERVRLNERRVQTILESAQDPYIGIDLQGRVIEWNSRAEAVFGWPAEELVGRAMADTLLARDEREAFRQLLEEAGARGAPGATEHTFVTREGREVAVELSIGLVDTGTQRFFAAFARDISDRKAVERMKDEFVATASHELRTPLTSIYGSLSILAAGGAGELPPAARELIGVSHASAQRLVRMVDDLLDVEKMAAGKMRYRVAPQSLRALARQAVDSTEGFANARNVRLVLADGPDAAVLADADRIGQVIVNLLSNAAKFSPAGGDVTVAVEVQGAHARLSVTDQGPGVPPEFRDRVFERFAQADASDRRVKGGTGLGLAISRSIVLAHDGRIDYVSDPGRGTTFFFELPLLEHA